MEKWYINLYKEKNVVDMWNINQIIGGIFIASIFLIFNQSLTIAILATLILTLIWEIYELQKGLYEAPINKLLDIFTSVLGVYIAYYLISLNLLSVSQLSLVSGVIFITLEIWGYLASNTLKNSLKNSLKQN